MLPYALYRAVTSVGQFGLGPFLKGRLRRGKEDPNRIGERRGLPGRSRPSGPLVWFHGASVGEATALLPLIEKLTRDNPAITLLLTTGTRTSADLMAARLPLGVIHQYVPVDVPEAVDSFLDHWRPDLVIWTESDLWPNLLTEADNRAIPRVLLNGRMSERSFAKWRYGRSLIRPLLGGFSLCLGQTEGDARRLAILGAVGAISVGNLKLAAPPPPVDADVLAEASKAIGSRPRWLMASTHADEEALAARVHQRLKVLYPDVLTLIVPRHPERVETIESALVQGGLVVTRRSRGWPDMNTDIWLGDTMGEMGLYARLSPIVVMGKTFPEACAQTGGQNPIEPAQLDSAVLWGPGMSNFTEIAHALENAGGALCMTDERDLATTLERLLGNGEEVARLALAAKNWSQGEQRVLDRVIEQLKPFIERLSPPQESPDARP